MLKCDLRPGRTTENLQQRADQLTGTEGPLLVPKIERTPRTRVEIGWYRGDGGRTLLFPRCFRHVHTLRESQRWKVEVPVNFGIFSVAGLKEVICHH